KDASSGILHLHSQGVAHRDIKYSLTCRSSQGGPSVLDQLMAYASIGNYGAVTVYHH
ncbi:hypothetical protein SCLCIDRAFT_1175804, partial [Scleroderma citrinum Foug A]